MTLAVELTETVAPGDLRDGTNVTGTDINAYLVVTGYYDAISLPAATTSAVLGAVRSGGIAVAGVTPGIKNGAHGSIALRGMVQLTAGAGGWSKGNRLMPEAATGKLVPWTSGNSVVGIAQSDVAADARGMVELLGPGATAQ